MRLVLISLFITVGWCSFETDWGTRFQQHSSLPKEQIRNVFSTEKTIEPLSRSSSAAAVLTANPSKIADMGHVDIHCSFSDYTPFPADYIIVSCGPVNDIHDYLDKVDVKDRADNNTFAVRFTELVFMRCDYKFTYIGTTFYPKLKHMALGSLTVPSAEPPQTPKLGHLAYKNDPTRMTVQYVSSSTKYKPSVKFAKKGDAKYTVVTGGSVTYKASDFCQGIANITAQRAFRDPGYTHTIELSGLTPASDYVYQYGNDQDGWSATFPFRSAPLVGPQQTTKFIALGDQAVAVQSRNTSIGVAKYIMQGDAHYVLHFGDLGYAMGAGWIWDKWQYLITVLGLSTHVPYMVVIGNHEYDHDEGHQKDPSHDPPTGHSSFEPSYWNDGPNASGGECGVATNVRFAAPPTGRSIFWYSFDYGNVHIVQFTSEHNWTVGSLTWKWLEQDLAKVDRSKTPWLVVTLHRPLYSTQECQAACYVISLHMRSQLESLFIRYKVNMVLTAHTHSYERICPVLNGKCVENGNAPVYYVVGTAGATLVGCGFSPRYGGNISRAHYEGYGFMRVEASQTELKTFFYKDSDGSLFDEYSIKPYTV